MEVYFLVQANLHIHSPICHSVITPRTLCLKTDGKYTQNVDIEIPFPCTERPPGFWGGTFWR